MGLLAASLFVLALGTIGIALPGDVGTVSAVGVNIGMVVKVITGGRRRV